MIDNSGIFERQGKNGLSLQVQLKYDTPNGRKTFTRTIKVSDYQDKKSAYIVARMIRDKARIDIATEKVITNKCPTVEYFFNKHLEIDGMSLKTKEKHKSFYEIAIKQFADIPLDKIKTADIQQSLTEYAETHSQDQIKRVITTWKAIYHCALMLEYEITDKTVALNKVKSKKVVVKRNTHVDIETFDNFCIELLKYNSQDGKPNKVTLDIWYMLQIMRYTGCRTAEVLALNKEDYDKKNHILHINKSVGSTGTETRKIIPTKTIESIRNVPCTQELETILDSLILYSNTSPLICCKDGKPYEIDIISNTIHLVSKKTGIQFNAYMLRHLFSTTLFNNGVNSAIIRDLMGHASSSMSLGYANTTKEDRERAIEKIK